MNRLTGAQNAAIVAQLSPELEPSTPLPNWNDVAMETIYLRNHITHLEAQLAAANMLADAEADNRAAVEAERADCTDELRLAVAAAVKAEREACAKIAESSETPIFKDGWSVAQDGAAISAMSSIAAAIRARAGKGE